MNIAEFILVLALVGGATVPIMAFYLMIRRIIWFLTRKEVELTKEQEIAIIRDPYLKPRRILLDKNLKWKSFSWDGDKRRLHINKYMTS